MKTNRVYRVIDINNGFDLKIVAKSVGDAGAIARRNIAKQRRDKFIHWQTDNSTGGWKGVSIELPECIHVHVPRPTSRPQRNPLPWKAKQPA